MNGRRVGLMIVAALTATWMFSAQREHAAAAGASAPVAYQQMCVPQSDRVNVIFLWMPSGEGRQSLDLSRANNGFARGTFVTAGPLDARQFAVSWEGLLPGATHVARVNTLTPRGWEPSPAYSFTTRLCQPPISSPVVFEQHCSTARPGAASVTFHWAPADTAQQSLDLSLFNNDFAPGTFIASGPLPSGQAELTWDGLAERKTHYARINALTPTGWRPSPAVPFTTISCSLRGRTITLTFDDGGDSAGPILDVLARSGVKAIFFPTGMWAKAHPDLIKRMIAEGHLVGDHTDTHAYLTRLPEPRIRAEIAAGNVGNTNLFRPPYGAFNSLVISIVQDMGFRLFLWNVDPRDWARTYPGGDREIVDAVTSRAFPGAVVVLHLQVRNALLALPTIIERLRAAGYTIGW